MARLFVLASFSLILATVPAAAVGQSTSNAESSSDEKDVLQGVFLTLGVGGDVQVDGVEPGVGVTAALTRRHTWYQASISLFAANRLTSLRANDVYVGVSAGPASTRPSARWSASAGLAYAQGTRPSPFYVFGLNVPDGYHSLNATVELEWMSHRSIIVDGFLLGAAVTGHVPLLGRRDSEFIDVQPPVLIGVSLRGTYRL